MEALLTPENIANGLVFLVFSILAMLGIVKRGPPARGSGDSRIEVAGALIDSTDAKAIIAAIEGNTRAIERNTEAAERVASRVEDAGHDVRNMTTELVRSQAR